MYVTTHDYPCSCKRDAGLNFFCLFALRTAATSQPQPPTKWCWRVLPPQPHVIVCCHCLLHLFLSYWTLIYSKTMLLHITSPACLQMQCGVDFVCFICPWDSCHVSHQSHDDKGPPLPIPHTTTNGTDQKDNTMRKAAGQVKLSMYFIYLLYTILRLVYN